jgi:DNA-binding winged helix-turn-helix (wHTH) protein/Tol biopolymer transport system component
MPGNDGHSRRFRFGAYELDEAAHELRKSGLSIHLQEQPWEVLCALLERHGEVVSREDLRHRLWPDGTFVDYEQSLNKAVNKLREALCDAADRPRYVETLARRGFRLVAAVEQDEPNQSRTVPVQTPNSHSRLWWGVGGIGSCLLGLLVTGLWPVPAPKARVIQLTNGGRPKTPFFAVRGGRILYASEAPAPERFGTEFWSVPTSGGEPRRERMPFLNPKFESQMRSTNSQHGHILIRSGDPSRLPGELWLVEFDGNRPRRIGSASLDSLYSVSPDLKTLLRASREGLFASSVGGGPERLVSRIDWQGPSYTFWHPSGDRIGFFATTKGVTLVREVKIDGTGMRALLPEFGAEQRAANWSPDGHRLYFSSHNEIFVREDRRWLGWMRRPKPIRLTAGSIRYSISVEDPTDPNVIYSTGLVRHGEAMKLNSRTGNFEPFLDGLAAECLDYSPDGQWIAYVTFPARELWKCRLDGSDKTLLEDGMEAFLPRWSPDGKRLAFAAARKGTALEPFRIYTIASDGGPAQPLDAVNGPGFDPNWLPDGKKLVFAPYEYRMVPRQDRHISIVDLATGKIEKVPGSDDMYSARSSPDGKQIVAFNWVTSGTFLYDLESGNWVKVHEMAVAYPKWSKDSKYIYGILGPQSELVRIEVATRRVEELRTIKEFRLTGSMYPGVSWTLDWEPIVLADLSTNEIYRIEVER